MVMRKYTSTDSGAKVLTPDAHKNAQEALHKQGKTSAANLTPEERQKFSDDLKQAE